MIISNIVLFSVFLILMIIACERNGYYGLFEIFTGINVILFYSIISAVMNTFFFFIDDKYLLFTIFNILTLMGITSFEQLKEKMINFIKDKQTIYYKNKFKTFEFIDQIDLIYKKEGKIYFETQKVIMRREIFKKLDLYLIKNKIGSLNSRDNIRVYL